MIGHRRGTIALDEYRELVALDEPFAPPPAPPTRGRAALFSRVLDHLVADGTAKRLRTSTAEPIPSEPRAWLQALLTVRPPASFPDSVQEALDGLLRAQALERPSVDVAGLPRLGRAPAAPLDACALWRGDITTLAADTIVNAANAELLGCFRPFHACIDNAIHTAAGPRLREDCARIMQAQNAPEPVGCAKATRAYHLPSRFVLHTVGPIVRGALEREHEEALAACYRACLETAARIGGVRTVALCAVSTGVFGFPREPAAVIAVRTVVDWLRAHPEALDLVVFNVFSDRDRQAYERALRVLGFVP